MKKLLFTTILIVSMFNHISINAQKYAFVDINYILDELPEYRDAQKELNNWAEKWQQEIQALYLEIDKKVQALQQEQILLPIETRKQREAEIAKMQQEVKELQQKRFGPTGDLFKKRQEIIEPVQVKIYKAIKDMANEKGYDFVLDKGTQGQVLFANPKYDKSDEILKKVKTMK
jgi:outer membrane protein